MKAIKYGILFFVIAVAVGLSIWNTKKHYDDSTEVFFKKRTISDHCIRELLDSSPGQWIDLQQCQEVCTKEYAHEKELSEQEELDQWFAERMHGHLSWKYIGKIDSYYILYAEHSGSTWYRSGFYVIEVKNDKLRITDTKVGLKDFAVSEPDIDKHQIFFSQGITAFDLLRHVIELFPDATKEYEEFFSIEQTAFRCDPIGTMSYVAHLNKMGKLTNIIVVSFRTMEGEPYSRAGDIKSSELKEFFQDNVQLMTNEFEKNIGIYESC